jgi:hypothetical protein
MMSKVSVRAFEGLLAREIIYEIILSVAEATQVSGDLHVQVPF